MRQGSRGATHERGILGDIFSGSKGKIRKSISLKRLIGVIDESLKPGCGALLGDGPTPAGSGAVGNSTSREPTPAPPWLYVRRESPPAGRRAPAGDETRSVVSLVKVGGEAGFSHLQWSTTGT
jgi:hypothetical protein